jgi:hypothetical protein
MQNSMTQTPASSSPKTAKRRTLLRWLFFFALTLLLLLQPMRVGLATYQAVRTLRHLSTVLAAVDHPMDLLAMQGGMAALTTDLIHLQSTLSPFMPLLAQLEFIPRYGPLLATADQLVAAGVQATTLADKGLGLLDAALPNKVENNGPPHTKEWVALGPIIAPLVDEFRALEASLVALPLTQIGGSAGDRLIQAHALVKLATIATAMGNEWDELLGVTRPATYLFVVQNNHELRPTGGFISAIAPVTLADGELRTVDFVDSYAIYSPELAYPPAPEPMRAYMGIELLTLRDANWSPDLPSAAALIRTLYQQHTGLATDGVITVDLDAVALILPAFGHLTLAGSSAPITQANVEEALVELWNEPAASQNSAQTPETAPKSGAPEDKGQWWTQRKDFIGQLTGAAFARLQQGNVDPLTLAAGIGAALDRRSLQAWLLNPVGQAALAEYGWDGGLHPHPNADFIAVVDTNMGYNKVDALLTRALDYQVRWPDDPARGAEATLTLTYTHPVNVSDPVCRAESYYGASYQDMIARCYFNYSRVYLPGGSELVEAQGWIAETVTSRSAEQGTEQFAGYFVLTPGTKHQVTLRYRLPPSLRPAGYKLLLQRQSGTAPLDLHVQSGDRQLQTRLVEGQLEWSPDEELPPAQ